MPLHYAIRGQSSRGLEHSKTLRVHADRGTARQRRGVRRPSAAFPHTTPKLHKVIPHTRQSPFKPSFNPAHHITPTVAAAG
jgi:hypothetical protein